MRPLMRPLLGTAAPFGDDFGGIPIVFPTAAPDSRFGGLVIYNQSKGGGRTWMLAFKSYGVSVVWGPVCQIGSALQQVDLPENLVIGLIQNHDAQTQKSQSQAATNQSSDKHSLEQ